MAHFGFLSSGGGGSQGSGGGFTGAPGFSTPGSAPRASTPSFGISPFNQVGRAPQQQGAGQPPQASTQPIGPGGSFTCVDKKIQ